MEFIRGQKLASLPRAEIRALVDVGQTAFLVQLLDVGYLHADPHPGNLMKVTPARNPGAGCLLWCACFPGTSVLLGYRNAALLTMQVMSTEVSKGLEDPARVMMQCEVWLTRQCQRLPR